ncbi:uncharacterized sporulation protein YeaH/YhbH (DUF444 family) [Paenibacillus harenae]|nr:uncharacterized sporulation protein YeaH/YhbH (DUF444 family) [Paenibacillus harenae]
MRNGPSLQHFMNDVIKEKGEVYNALKSFFRKREGLTG